MNTNKKKENIWQHVDQFDEMDASDSDVHQLRHENLQLEGVVVYDQRKLEQGLILSYANTTLPAKQLWVQLIQVIQPKSLPTLAASVSPA